MLSVSLFMVFIFLFKTQNCKIRSGAKVVPLFYDLKQMNVLPTYTGKFEFEAGAVSLTAARRPTAANRQPEGSGKPTAANQLRSED